MAAISKFYNNKTRQRPLHSPQNVKPNWCDLKCGDNTVDLHVWTKETIPWIYMFGQRVPAGRKEHIVYGRLRASSSLASYRRLEKAKLTS